MNQEFIELSSLLAFAKTATKMGDKAFCRLGRASETVVQQAAIILNISIQEFEIVVDSDAIRHTLAQHGVAKSKLEIARGQIPIVETDLLALSDWVLQAATMRAGQVKAGMLPRLEIEQVEASGTTIAIVEWRPGRRQLALITMYKKRPVA
ncbi:MAG: hypothetical protein ACRYFZ_16595 [Janthinobacterium lividum]